MLIESLSERQNIVIPGIKFINSADVWTITLLTIQAAI